MYRPPTVPNIFLASEWKIGVDFFPYKWTLKIIAKTELHIQIILILK